MASHLIKYDIPFGASAWRCYVDDRNPGGPGGREAADIRSR
jgi:hypothetical protein